MIGQRHRIPRSRTVSLDSRYGYLPYFGAISFDRTPGGSTGATGRGATLPVVLGIYGAPSNVTPCRRRAPRHGATSFVHWLGEKPYDSLRGRSGLLLMRKTASTGDMDRPPVAQPR